MAIFGDANDDISGFSWRLGLRFLFALVLAWLIVIGIYFSIDYLQIALTWLSQILSIAFNYIEESVGLPRNLILVGGALSIYASLAYFVARDKEKRDLIYSIFRAMTWIFVQSERPSHDFREANPVKDSVVKSLQEEVRKLKEAASKQSLDSMVGGEWNEQREKLIDEVVKDLSGAAKGEIQKEVFSDRVLRLEQESLLRLSGQVVALGFRANIALFIGAIVCSAGLIILWESLDRDDIGAYILDAPDSYTYFLFTMAPRVSLVLLLEVVGFFFLRIFRSTLDEVRLVQNEMTNVEMKLIALNLSRSSSSESQSDVISSFLETERNVVIEKGQTTVELEKARGARELESRYVDALFSIIKSKK